MSIKAKDLYQKGSDLLKEAKIPDWDYDSRVLLEWTCNITRMDLLLEPDKRIDKDNADRFFTYIKRRCCHEPLQYLIGEWEFMGLPFKVNPNVLIPRQDTECLIEWILEEEKGVIREEDSQSIELLDVCTGSGCIAISLDLLLEEQNGLSVRTDAVDISKGALETATENSAMNQASVTFIESNMFENVDKSYDIIVSNPPYIPTKVVDGLMAEVVEFEPRLALDGMEDGLYFYRILAKEGKNHLKAGGRLYLEIGHDQSETVPEILKEEGFAQIEVRKDLAGNHRCVRAVYQLGDELR